MTLRRAGQKPGVVLLTRSKEAVEADDECPSVSLDLLCDSCMYAFHLRPRGSNGTVAVRLIVVVWPVRSMHRAAVLVLLAGETSLSGSP